VLGQRVPSPGHRSSEPRTSGSGLGDFRFVQSAAPSIVMFGTGPTSDLPRTGARAGRLPTIAPLTRTPFLFFAPCGRSHTFSVVSRFFRGSDPTLSAGRLSNAAASLLAKRWLGVWSSDAVVYRAMFLRLRMCFPTPLHLPRTSGLLRPAHAAPSRCPGRQSASAILTRHAACTCSGRTSPGNAIGSPPLLEACNESMVTKRRVLCARIATKRQSSILPHYHAVSCWGGHRVRSQNSSGRLACTIRATARLSSSLESISTGIGTYQRAYDAQDLHGCYRVQKHGARSAVWARRRYGCLGRLRAATRARASTPLTVVLPVEPSSSVENRARSVT